jgi:hypothetical protein
LLNLTNFFEKEAPVPKTPGKGEFTVFQRILAALHEFFALSPQFKIPPQRGDARRELKPKHAGQSGPRAREAPISYRQELIRGGQPGGRYNCSGQRGTHRSGR